MISLIFQVCLDNGDYLIGVPQLKTLELGSYGQDSSTFIFGSLVLRSHFF